MSPTSDPDAAVDLMIPSPAPDLGPTPVPCGDGPGQRCCENASVPCNNNCGTAGTRTCTAGVYGTCSVADTCCGDAACANNCGEKGARTCSGTTWSACPVPMRACCPGDTMACQNNCGTPGTRTCAGGAYGGCSQANTCCGDRSCSNNCGENGTRPCNGTTLGNCPVPNRACCPGATMACSNSCGMSGTIPCRNGSFNDNDCTAKDSSCAGGPGQQCRSGNPKCDNGLFCCPDPGICDADVNKCLNRRVTGGKCNYSPDDSNCATTHYCDGDSDTCQPRKDVGQPCSDQPGSPKCKTGLRCEPVAGVCE